MNVYPATHFVTPGDKLKEALVDIEAEMEVRVGELEAQGRILEAARLRQRTVFDLEMMRELGYCSGVENYSRHLSRRDAGSRPWTLLDYFPPDWLLVVDESHMTIPQVVGMYKNDRTRKEILVDFGFRLPSALDNRPLTFEEFESTVKQAVYMSATPGPYELERSEQIVEQLIRPTGVVDPQIVVRPTEGQIDDLLEEIRKRVERGERSLVTTLTKKMAEDLTDYLRELGVKVQYLHSEVDTLERVQILRDLRLGVFDVLVGINLLREGIDLPEVTLVAILDADKEGFLRSAWSLIQMIGRAARNIGGEVVMYADRVTDSMRAAIDETDRRRAIQEALQPRARDRADDDRQGDPRHQRAAARRRRDERGLRRGRPGRAIWPARPRGAERGPDRGDRRADGSGDEERREEPRVRTRRRPPRRDPADPAAGPRAGRLDGRRAGGRGCGGEGARTRSERLAVDVHAAPGSTRGGARGAQAGGHHRHGPARRRGRARRRARRADGRDRLGLAAGHPRRARGRRRRLAGPLARPPDVGPHRHAERGEAHRRPPAAARPPPALNLGRRRR